jgi:UDP-N-acetyl-D-glucosamine dehydrogenase
MGQSSSDQPTAAVIGLGYVGLPLALAALRAGVRVVGYDISANVVGNLRNGRSHIDDVSDAELVEMLSLGFEPTSEPSDLDNVDTYVICVPTPLTKDGQPELTAILGASEAVSGALRPGNLVVLESTTFPGTTEEIVGPILERSGLRAGLDFHLVFSPERVDPGNAEFGITNTPKIVGGLTAECSKAAERFYGQFIEKVVVASGTREAEMAKLLENTYRHINIALVNELAIVCHELDVDVWDVIDCAATKPFGFQAFYPGPGVGGHCIPIDPNYLSYAVKSRLGYPFRFVELAQEINASMPRYVLSRIQELLNRERKALNGARVLLVGVTYKANIADERESPARPLATLMLEQGADVSYLDPFVDEWIPGVTRQVPGEGCEVPYDAVVVLQHHRDVDFIDCVGPSTQVLDTRGRTMGDLVEVL